MASNYPIVQCTCHSAGNISYARSFDWSSTGVATGSAVETTEFALPANLAAGTYSVRVIANGIPSAPFSQYFGGPITLSDTVTVPENTIGSIDVGLANDLPGNDPIDPATVTIVAPPVFGTAQASTRSRGTVTYTPNTNYYGSDSFQYTVQDTRGRLSNVSTVNITIPFVDQPPVAESDVAATPANTPVTIDVLGNDYSPQPPKVFSIPRR